MQLLSVIVPYPFLSRAACSCGVFEAYNCCSFHEVSLSALKDSVLAAEWTAVPPTEQPLNSHWQRRKRGRREVLAQHTMERGLSHSFGTPGLQKSGDFSRLE